MLTVFGVISAYLWLKIVDLETKMRDLGNNYVQLRESPESLLSEISNPLRSLSKMDAIKKALEYDGLNETVLSHVNVSPTLYFVRFEETDQSFGFKILFEVEEPEFVCKPCTGRLYI